MIADGGETRPDSNTVRIAPGLFGGVLDGAHAALQGLRGEVGVQNDVVEKLTAETKRVGAEGDECQTDVLVEIGVEHHHRVLTHRSVVADDHLAAP